MLEKVSVGATISPALLRDSGARAIVRATAQAERAPRFEAGVCAARGRTVRPSARRMRARPRLVVVGAHPRAGA